MTVNLLVCPQCKSDQVSVTVETKYNVNTGDHYCHSIKAHDPHARVDCLDCFWSGKRNDLLIQEQSK